MALPLPREVREGLETFAIPLRLMSGAGFMVAAICLAPALIMPNKTVAKEFAAVGRTGAIASLLAAVPGIAIGIVLNKDSENILTSLEAATRVEPSISRATDFDGCSPATSGHIVSEMVALFQQPGDSVKKPAACVDCQHYDGHSYGGNPFICAMHPYGWDTEQCPDWEGQRTCFRIVRIQGADRPALYLIKDDPERSLCELVRCGCLISGGTTTKLLCKRYRLKSPNGLPGCRFDAQSDNPLEALNELIGSCLTESS